MNPFIQVHICCSLSKSSVLIRVKIHFIDKKIAKRMKMANRRWPTDGMTTAVKKDIECQKQNICTFHLMKRPTKCCFNDINILFFYFPVYGKGFLHSLTYCSYFDFLLKLFWFYFLFSIHYSLILFLNYFSFNLTSIQQFSKG